MRISVTAEDIAEGEKYKCERCPVALGIIRVVRPVPPQVLMAGAFAAVLWDKARGKAVWSVELPPSAQQFITDFDHGSPVAPFEFDLEVPA